MRAHASWGLMLQAYYGNSNPELITSFGLRSAQQRLAGPQDPLIYSFFRQVQTPLQQAGPPFLQRYASDLRQPLISCVEGSSPLRLCICIM